MRIIIAASGTGGHIYPGIALARFAKKNLDDVFYIGTNNKLTKVLVTGENINFYPINMTGWQGRKISTLFKAILNFFISIIKVSFLFREIKPDIVVGMGGYVCLPVIFMAWIMRIPRVIQEQNSFAGVTNKVLARIVDKIFIAFDDVVRFFPKAKTVSLGNPIREEFYSIDKSAARKFFDIDSDEKVVFVFGGSQGAHNINLKIKDMLSFFIGDKIVFIHITGRTDFELMQNAYRENNIKAKVYEYLDEIYYAYYSADLIIARSGAGACFEIMTAGVPSILIPYPFATDNHQYFNAKYLEEKNISRIIEESKLSSENLVSSVKNILADDKMRENAKKVSVVMHASRPEEKIYDAIKELAID